jgi:hypothetical protein
MVLPLGRQRLSAATRLLFRRKNPSLHLLEPTLSITSPNHFPSGNHGRFAILPFSTRADTESATPSINQAGVDVNVDLDQRFHSQQKGYISKRKHFWTLDELNQRTEKLIAVIASPTSEDRNKLGEDDYFNVLGAWMEKLIAVIASPTSEDRKQVSEDDCFNVLEAWMEFAKEGHGLQTAIKAQTLLDQMEKASFIGNTQTSCYEVVLKAYVVSRGLQPAAEAAQKLLERMLSRCRAYHENRQGRPPPEPRGKTFNLVMTCWTKSETVQAGHRAEQVYATMQTWGQECQSNRLEDPSSPYDGCLPKGSSFKEVINARKKAAKAEKIIAWARAHRSAIAMFEKLKNFAEPDLITYNAVLSAYSHAGMGHEATGMLEWLEATSETNHGKLQPDIISYNSVLTALAKDREPGSSERADALLERMERLSESGKTYARPNKVSFTTVIEALSRWEIKGQALKSYALVTKMIKKYEAGDRSMKPDVFVFSVLMKACGRTKGRQKDKHNALSMALDAMKALETKEFGPPNHIAFLTLTIAVNELLRHEPERDNILASVFERCCEGGYVSKQVIAAAAQESKEFESVIKQMHLYPSWFRNVPLQDRPSIKQLQEHPRWFQNVAGGDMPSIGKAK